MKIILGVFSLLFAAIGMAQQYTIDRFVVASGGGTSSGGVFAVTGTIGQADADAAMTNANYSLTGGFWSIYAVQSPGSPLLQVQVTANSVKIAWPSASAGYSLQVSTSVSGGSWTTPAETVSDDGTYKYITVNPSMGNRFYRLSSP